MVPSRKFWTKGIVPCRHETIQGITDRHWRAVWRHRDHVIRHSVTPTCHSPNFFFNFWLEAVKCRGKRALMINYKCSLPGLNGKYIMTAKLVHENLTWGRERCWIHFSIIQSEPAAEQDYGVRYSTCIASACNPDDPDSYTVHFKWKKTTHVN